MLVFDALDLGAQLGELFDDALVAALDVVDVLDVGGAFGGQACDDEGSSGPEVLGVDGGTLELPLAHAGDVGGLASTLILAPMFSSSEQ